MTVCALVLGDILEEAELLPHSLFEVVCVPHLFPTLFCFHVNWVHVFMPKISVGVEANGDFFLTGKF